MKYYINNTIGNDITGTGTIYLPFKTIAKAFSLSSDGDKIYLLRGSHTEQIISLANRTFNIPVKITSLGKATIIDSMFGLQNSNNIIIENINFSATVDSAVIPGTEIKDSSNITFRNNKYIKHSIIPVTVHRNSHNILIENNLFAHAGYACFQAGSSTTDQNGNMIGDIPISNIIYRNNIGYWDLSQYSHNGLNSNGALQDCLFENNIHFGWNDSWQFFNANLPKVNLRNIFRNNIAFDPGPNGSGRHGGIVINATGDIVENCTLFNCSVGIENMSSGNDDNSISLCSGWFIDQCGPSKYNIIRNNWIFNNFMEQIMFSGGSDSILENNKTSGEGDLFGAGHVISEYPYTNPAANNVIKNYPVGTYEFKSATADNLKIEDTNGRLSKFLTKTNLELTPDIVLNNSTLIFSRYNGRLYIYNIKISSTQQINANVTSNNLNGFLTTFVLTPTTLTSIEIYVDKLTPNNTYTVLKNSSPFASVVANSLGEIHVSDNISSATTYDVSGTNTRYPIANIEAHDLKYYDYTTTQLTRRWLFIGKDDNGFGGLQNLNNQWKFFDSNNVEIFPSATMGTALTEQAVIVELPVDGTYYIEHTTTNNANLSNTKTMQIEVISQYAEVEGYIKDTGGNPIEDAVITINNITEISHANGYYCLQNIPMNKIHQVQVTKAGYNNYSGTTLSIDSPIKALADITISTGGCPEVVVGITIREI